MNAVERRLAEALRRYRSGPARDKALARKIEANLTRARLLPADLGAKYVLVNVADQSLTMVQDGKIVDRMPVVVGKRGMETPMLAGKIRFAMLQPYWNMPPDLARAKARRIEIEGTALLDRERLEAVSDWSEDAYVIDPIMVDWHAMAEGRGTERLRQLPGPNNMMGQVKFMLPNALGIYLHDTPDKAAFGRTDRRRSSGCVRVEDAPRLARWLFGGVSPVATGIAEQRVDLPEPVPVYITYLTVVATGEGVTSIPDIYHRDGDRIATARGKLARS